MPSAPLNRPASKMGGMSLLWVLVSIVLGIVALGVAVIGFGLDESTSPIIVTILGIFSASIPSILALVKVSQVHTELTNGNLKANVQEATENAIENKQVLTRDGPVVAAQLATIETLLQERKKTNG
jgi:hypothetical protein